MFTFARQMRLCLTVVFCLLFLDVLPCRSRAADWLHGFAASDLEVTIYPDDSLVPSAVWKIKSISPEYRKMGFFSVRLLPVLVAEGIQLDFPQASPQTNWLEGFHCSWRRAADPKVVEWRDFSVFFPQEKSPRLRAKRVYPVLQGGVLLSRLEGVTLQAGSRTLSLPRAEVRAEGRAGEIVWHEAGETRRWDLFSNQFAYDPSSLKESHENP